jgi:hypothetical protein
MWRLICWFSLGIPFFLMGIAILRGTGRANRWYLYTQRIPYMPPSAAYIYFPLGCALSLPPLILALPIDGETKSNLVFITWGICFILIFVFPIWKPRFLKPKWLQRLEAQYPPDAIEMFEQEWKKIDRDEWARKIGTEDGMEELIKLVTDKYGEYDLRQKAFVKIEPILPGEGH